MRLQDIIYSLMNFRLSMMRRILYTLFYRWRYEPRGEFGRPHIFDSSITDRQIIGFFGYTKAIIHWMRDQGDATLRVDYPLGPNSIVFDVGGFSGAWCAEIVQRYDANVHVFEPIDAFAVRIADRFDKNPKVKVHRIGLSDREETVSMSVSGQGSSVLHDGRHGERVKMREISSFVAEQGIERIDLIKINIEGGEYALLLKMIETGMIMKCEHIQVQFHDWVRGARHSRSNIQGRLQETHELSYEYPFVWESWKKRTT